MSSISVRFGSRGLVDVALETGMSIGDVLSTPEVQDLVNGASVEPTLGGVRVSRNTQAQPGYLLDLEPVANTKG